MLRRAVVPLICCIGRKERDFFRASWRRCVMGDVVNFNQYRKERARAANKKRGAENRVRYGLGKLERSLPRKDRERAERDLEGKRLDTDAKPEDSSHSD
jgi:hypothetical protein